MIKTFQDLNVYKNSKKLYPVIVKITKTFPSESKYLVNQICRSANSIHANIAEGFGRSEAEFKKFLTTSLGSNNELLSHLEDAFLVGYLKKDIYNDLVKNYNIVGKQIFRLKEKWKKF